MVKFFDEVSNSFRDILLYSARSAEFLNIRPQRLKTELQNEQKFCLRTIADEVFDHWIMTDVSNW